ncbi:helix-turn-helix transcriptional regulator [Streptomyces sp. NRRL B-1347]|uniref:helix-turn-helix transcriptional regulator n=1 Tax=Streptomyces sp. NRRL B-1347 TaxID=1476877 RepID=UPI0004C6BCDF|nr:helix-turn-helix domain-containing protein [Streptomyces sp. NRRL B-1347]
MPKSFRTEHWLTAQEAADRLRVARKTLYNWASTWEVEHRGPKPFRMGGRALRYRESDVDRCMTGWGGED